MNNSRLKSFEKERVALFENLSNLTQAQLSYSKKGWSIYEILYHVWLAEASEWTSKTPDCTDMAFLGNI